MRFVNQGKPWSDKRIRSFIHKQEKLFWKEGYCRWVVEDKIKRNFVGLCGVGVFDPPGFLEIGWGIAKRLGSWSTTQIEGLTISFSQSVSTTG